MSTQRSLQELTERAQSILNTHTGQHNPAINALASTIAGISYGQYGYQDLLFRELHPETCSEPWLYLHAGRHDVPRLLPSFARGTVQFEQLDVPVVIPKGTLMNINSNDYETVKEQYSDAPVEVIALTAGTAGNVAAGQVLALTEALHGVSPNNVVSLGIEGGADIEKLAHWRARVVLAFRKQQSIGQREDYEEWALSAHADIDYAWVLDNTPERGMLEVYIGSRQDDPILSDEIVSLAQQVFEENRLAGCHPVAKVPEPVALPVEIQGIADQAVRTDVIGALSLLIQKKMGKIDPVTQAPESVIPTEIVLTISAVTSNFIVRSPTEESVIERHQIHVLGEVTWTPPT